MKNPLTLAQIVLDFGLVPRATLHRDGVTAETDTTHSLMLALVALEIVEAHQLPLDRARLLLLALVHDLPEVYAGDADTFGGLAPDALVAKAAREAQALERLREQLGDQHWLVQAIELYERQEVPEARFLRYLDKAMPRLTNALSGGAAVQRRGQRLDDLLAHHRQQDAGLAARYPEWVELLGAVLQQAAQVEVAAWAERAERPALTSAERLAALEALAADLFDGAPITPEEALRSLHGQVVEAQQARLTRCLPRGSAGEVGAEAPFAVEPVLRALASALPFLERNERAPEPSGGWPRLGAMITATNLDVVERLAPGVWDDAPTYRVLMAAFHLGMEQMRRVDAARWHAGIEDLIGEQRTALDGLRRERDAALRRADTVMRTVGVLRLAKGLQVETADHALRILEGLCEVVDGRPVAAPDAPVTDSDLIALLAAGPRAYTERKPTGQRLLDEVWRKFALLDQRYHQDTDALRGERDALQARLDTLLAPAEGVDLEEVLRLDQEATPGPWAVHGAAFRVALDGGIDYQFACAGYPRDMRLIAAYRTAAPALVREVACLRVLLTLSAAQATVPYDDPVRLHAAVNAERIRRDMSWRDLAAELGIASSGFTRWAQGSSLGLTAHLRVCGWLRAAKAQG